MSNFRPDHGNACEEEKILPLSVGEPTNGASGDLISRAQSGDSMAENAVVRQYERLVKNLAYRHKGALALEDATQEGRIGLMKAVKKYDPAKGSFENHARWWIRAAITRADENTSRNIRLPRVLSEARRKLEQVSVEAFREGSQMPSVEELVDLTGLTLEKIRQVMRTPVEQFTSLDASVGDIDDRPFHELLADPKASCDPMRVAAVEAFLSRARELIDSHKYGEYWMIFLNAKGLGEVEESIPDAAQRLGEPRPTVQSKVIRALEVVLDDSECRQSLLEMDVSEEALEAKFEQIDKALGRGKKRK